VNIFILDRDPALAAQYLCDLHIGKVGQLEAAQIMSTVQRRYGNVNPALYKPTHANHPCTRWAGDTVQNYAWLYAHFAAASAEYVKRRGKYHATWTKLCDALKQPPEGMPDLGHMTPFALAMPEQHKTKDKNNKLDAVASYRSYYSEAKRPLLTYKAPADWPVWLSSV
jgi:hypothetical protein